MLLAAALGMLAVPPAANAAFPGTNGKLAFVSPRSGFPTDTNLFTMNVDGSSQTPIISFNGDELYPSWSPDGTKLAFQQDAGTSPEIWVAGQTGASPVRLTNNTDGDRHPAWSPDATKIVFASDRSAGSTLNDLYVMNPDGTGQTAITNTPSVDEAYPSWSADGTKIVFSRDGDLATISPTGTNLVMLTATERMEIEPDWAPNMSQIVFRVGINADDEIYKMNADGSGVTALTTTGPVVKERPTWSPDGTKIAYVRGAFNTAEIWVMNADGNNKTQITTNGYLDFQPAWQPIPILSYPRPGSARKNNRYYLVPAFAQCTNPNRQHGPPLASPSCNPPTLISPYIYMKSNWISYLAIKVFVGDSNTTADEAQVKFTTKVQDLYQKSNNRGYNREVRMEIDLRWTDRNNVPNPGGPGPGTMQDVTLGWTVPCFRRNPDPLTMGDCSINLKDNVLLPNLIQESKRTIIDIRDVRLYDGGSDNDADTLADNRLLGKPGVFIP